MITQVSLMIAEIRQRITLRIVRDHRPAHSGGIAKHDLGGRIKAYGASRIGIGHDPPPKEEWMSRW
jgi:hypothetical protein